MFEGPVTGNIPEVLDNGEVTDGTHVTAGQLALALTPYSGNNAAAIQSLDDRVTAELASKLDSSALAPAIAPLATAAALATTDGQVAAHGSSIAALQLADHESLQQGRPVGLRRAGGRGGHEEHRGRRGSNYSTTAAMNGSIASANNATLATASRRWWTSTP